MFTQFHQHCLEKKTNLSIKSEKAIKYVQLGIFYYIHNYEQIYPVVKKKIITCKRKYIPNWWNWL